MTRHDMPFLVLNLGVEMIFVLHSRLRAQAVPPDKAEDVMRDIGSNLFSSAFVAELFTPQPLYTPASVLQVFATLSNSSVIHLSDNSMKKLYDLVFMTVKYQLLTLRHPLELYELTLNHLDTVLELVPTSVYPRVAEAAAKVRGLASAFTVGDWATLRRSLLNFFGGRHVRVSVFLENKVQNAATGAFYIPRDTYLSPAPSCRPPGLVYFTKVNAIGHFEHSDARLPYPPAITVGQWDPTNRTTRMTTNGFNMYAAYRSTSTSTSSAAVRGKDSFADPLSKQTREMPMPRPAASPAAATHGDHAANQVPAVSTSANSLSQAEQQRAYDAAANYLAKIAGATNRAPGQHTFELELFEEPAGHTTVSSMASSTASKTVTNPLPSPSPSAAAATAAAASSSPAVPLSRMTASAVQEQNKKLLGIMSDFDSRRNGDVGSSKLNSGNNGVGGGGDLLDIMDEV
ncbi:hypothetical protein ABB37_08006 [Leptomonas pyrrhocoris]|uniref:Organic solute transport protein 1 n=1 Tax=Leptomonas pyrrhocoris TaxID=157538 RepID=A0A0M9FUC9_LEPPY|nr:hypothetical protein ABB37_08006 [Leptomonas pyrrhocoris]KPA76270.1 hypothetical protein ABB37_08006 [Leptomonas pyrrhocoris]|eukprot:XP_015654709.1 hypothetical protein ABB37_08006 [Leptomonas pyrrhocoris]